MEFLTTAKQSSLKETRQEGTFEVNPATKPKTITIFPKRQGN